jgi:hypothetical protein
MSAVFAMVTISVLAVTAFRTVDTRLTNAVFVAVTTTHAGVVMVSSTVERSMIAVVHA